MLKSSLDKLSLLNDSFPLSGLVKDLRAVHMAAMLILDEVLAQLQLYYGLEEDRQVSGF